MAIKIIKEGNKKEVFEGWCMYCGCEFEYEKEDTSGSYYDQREKCNYYCIKCPCCNMTLWIASVIKRD